ncbi:hypothetical protein [Actinocorallia libanotica]|uniref:Uncharacterized protein n=1 Tax=Actinocorallia libanotica TaxID=46162 RepID=A0ABP4BXZ0_9ACTN
MTATLDVDTVLVDTILEVGQAALLGGCQSASMLKSTCHDLADALRDRLAELLTGTQALPVQAAEILIVQTAQRVLERHQSPPPLREQILAGTRAGLAVLHDTAPATSPPPANRGQPQHTTRAQRRKPT